MQVTINGDVREVPENSTIAEFLETRNLLARMVVVEHNGAIVPREQYADSVLSPGDTLEIVQMMAGG
jgi:sulfur carrier protein